MSNERRIKAIVDMPEVEFHKLRMAGTLKGESLEPSDLELLKQGLRLKINIWHSGHDEQTEALLMKLNEVSGYKNGSSSIKKLESLK